MTDAQKARYNAILTAQIAALNAAGTAFDTVANQQVSNLQTFKTTQDTAFSASIAAFSGTADQTALLNSALSQFDTNTTALITKAQAAEETADGQISAAVNALTALLV